MRLEAGRPVGEGCYSVTVGEGEDEGMVEAIPKGRVGAGGRGLAPLRTETSAVRLEHSSGG